MLGTAIREWQERGEIGSRESKTGRPSKSLADDARLSSPYDFAKHTDLYGDGKEGGNGIYAWLSEPDASNPFLIIRVRVVKPQTHPTMLLNQTLARRVAHVDFSVDDGQFHAVATPCLLPNILTKVVQHLRSQVLIAPLPIRRHTENISTQRQRLPRLRL